MLLPARQPRHFRRLYCCLLLLLAAALPGRAQLSPVLDPGFQSPALYRPAAVLGALQLSDGSRVVAGNFIRANGLPSSGLTRYLPGGPPDAGFNARIGANTWRVEAVRELPGGKLLVQFADTARVSGQRCASLVRLLPGGQRDSTFTSPTVPFSRVTALLTLPDGTIFLGLGAQGLVRLLPDGTVDTSFSQYSRAFLNGEVDALARQADGKILVGGDFNTVQGAARPGLARLLPSGTLDTSYQPALPPNSWCQHLAVQPADGAVLCSFSDSFNPTSPTLVRLLPGTGAADSGFQLDATVSFSFRASKWPVVQAQPNGAILLAGTRTLPGVSQQNFIVRLNPSGSYDPTWLVPSLSNSPQGAASLQLLPTGEVLVAAKGPKSFVAGGPASQVAVLGANGTYVPGFIPVLQQVGYLSSLAVQADGKMLIAGGFSEVNGVARPTLARLLPSGALDTSYGTSCALFPLLGFSVETATAFEPHLVLQPDGKLLVSGLVTNPSSQVAILRLLPSGCPDPTFVPDLQLAAVQNLSLQPDGSVLLTGLLVPPGPFAVVFGARLTASGSFDATYQLGNTGPTALQDQFLAQPDGTALLLKGGTNNSELTRLLPDGAFDPSFLAVSPRPIPGPFFTQALGVVRDATGRQLLFGQFGGAGKVLSGGVVRLLADGTPDQTFQTALFGGATTVVTAVAEQPNGRLLVGTRGDFGLQSLLPNGQFDGTFDPTQGPTDGEVRTIAVQPDGAILVAGTFTRVGQQARAGLARLLVTNVLAVSSQQLAARTSVWPVPAHGTLHLALDAAARPQLVELLDALGRVVLAQPVRQPTMGLATDALPAGVYLLRVRYANGFVTRRVVLE